MTTAIECTFTRRGRAESASCELHLGAADVITRIFSDIKPKLAGEALHLVILRQDLGADAREFLVPGDLDQLR
jgi:hypothetical protein